VVVDTAHHFYYADVVDLALKDPYPLETLSNKAMDTIHKEHMTTFHKQLPICKLSLGSKFLHEVQILGLTNSFVAFNSRIYRMFFTSLFPFIQEACYVICNNVNYNCNMHFYFKHESH